jgi:hypothetical protein
VPIPDEVRTDAAAALEEFALAHSSPDVQLRYRYEIQENAAVLIEEKPAFMNANEWLSVPIGKFRYSAAKKVWTLYWSDRRDHWKRVSGTEAAADIRTLLKAVIEDKSGVFWG